MRDKRFLDLEDALQFYSASTVARILVTGNKKDYSKAADGLEVLTPEEFLEREKE